MKVFDLEFSPDHYYIKRATIVEKISFSNRTFYAKFERIYEPLTPLLLEQHYALQYTIAVPLLQNGHTNYLVIEYKGEEYQRFYHLVQYLFRTMGLVNYSIFEGKDKTRMQVFIKVASLSLEVATSKLEEISLALQEKIAKRWKCLPSKDLPEAYNIVTLPYTALYLEEKE